MTRSLLFQQVLNGLAIGSVYAIFALGYTLIFSILRIINFMYLKRFKNILPSEAMKKTLLLIGLTRVTGGSR